MITKKDKVAIEQLVDGAVRQAVTEHEYRFDHFIHPEFVQDHLLTGASTNVLLREDGESVILPREERLIEELRLLSAAIRERLQLLGEE